MTLYTRKHCQDSERIFEGAIFSVRRDNLQQENSPRISREIVEHNGGVVIACQPEPGQIILIKQYRYPVDEELIELPAGRVEIGEDRLLAAKRELKEETGFEAKRWSLLADMYSAPGFCTELLSFYQALDLSFSGKNLDADEETDVLQMSLQESWQLVRQGKIRDAKTVAALGLLIQP